MQNSKFNDVTGLTRYRRPNEKRDALTELKDGIKGRAEKGYPDEKIAEEIRKHHSEHPILKGITGRDVRLFRKDSSGSKSVARKDATATVTPAVRPASTGGTTSQA